MHETVFTGYKHRDNTALIFRPLKARDKFIFIEYINTKPYSARISPESLAPLQISVLEPMKVSR